jgi:hypothetical protein
MRRDEDSMRTPSMPAAMGAPLVESTSGRKDSCLLAAGEAIRSSRDQSKMTRTQYAESRCQFPHVIGTVLLRCCGGLLQLLLLLSELSELIEIEAAAAG